MGPDLSHVSSAVRLPRLLIAESNFSTAESLVQTFRDRRLDVDFDFCTSHDQAMVKLFRSPSPYQLIISGVHLAEINDFFLLKHHLNLQPFVPFVITSGASDIESSRRALEDGAFDFIPTPLDYEQTVSTIRLALWHSKLKALTASRDKILERYRQHIDDYPGNRNSEAFRIILTSMELSISAHERTIDRIETSVKCFANFTKDAEEVRQQAFIRL
jgi:DNA-binding NtrC family response regulator